MTVNMSSTMTQPTATRPWSESSSPTLDERTQEHHGARDGHRTAPGSDRAREAPAEDDADADPGEGRASRPWPIATGRASDRTASRSRTEKWMPVPNMSSTTPSSASSVATAASAT